MIADGRALGSVEIHRNPFHNRNCYLDLHINAHNTSVAKPLFEAVAEKAGSPLQVMLSSTESEMVDFLLAGGFERKRRCFELEVTKADLAADLVSNATLPAFKEGAPEYATCCALLYAQYAKNHEAINPLTADFADFCASLPKTVFYVKEGNGASHFAFVEENEIAYVGSTEIQRFPNFALHMLADMFARYEMVCFECDDCDDSAMSMKNLFPASSSESFDTYTLCL